jgi:phosphatidate cytidylyltransferase
MGKRILVGTTLALSLIALLLLDAYLAEHTARWTPADPAQRTAVRWLTNGAICTTIVLVLAVLATHELVHLARGRGYRPFGRTAQFFAAWLVLGPYISYNLQDVVGGYDESWGLLWIAISIAFTFMLQAIIHRTDHAMENLATTLFILFYCGGLASFMTKLRMEVGGSTGVVLLLFSVFLVKMTDTGAYFVGSFLGRNKMVPWLSPRKTWEGFAGGMVVTVVLAVGIGAWLHHAGIATLQERYLPHYAAFAILGIGLGLFSAAGDLCASLLKRDAAVKDSGQALPGLGGVLDVFDSPLMAAPIAWVFWTRVFHLVPQTP